MCTISYTPFPCKFFLTLGSNSASSVITNLHRFVSQFYFFLLVGLVDSCPISPVNVFSHCGKVKIFVGVTTNLFL